MSAAHPKYVQIKVKSKKERRIPAPRTNTEAMTLFSNFFCGKLKHSAKINRAERNAVSPEVMDKTTTLSNANIPPRDPNKEVEISLIAPPGPTEDKTEDKALEFW